jgi:hypothetical protein
MPRFPLYSLLSTCILASISFGAGLVAPAIADEDDPDAFNPGICGLYNYSGSVVSTPAGQIVPLADYCTVQRAFYYDEAAIADRESLDDQFWQTFLEAASPSALEFAQSAGKAEVVAYGQTICPFLQEGRSLTDLRQQQSSSGIPQSFEAAVTVAAIYSYCPAYQDQLGR